jgi:hypothetical protein
MDGDMSMKYSEKGNCMCIKKMITNLENINKLMSTQHSLRQLDLKLLSLGTHVSDRITYSDEVYPSKVYYIYWNFKKVFSSFFAH